MKVLHICLGCFYIDNYSYQENILPKYHKELGYDVEILASLISFDKNGKQCFLENGKYINENGIPVTRLDYKKFSKRIRRFQGTYNSIQEANPNIIFIHGSQFWDIRQVLKYVRKNPEVQIYVDNHADFYNSGRNWVSRNIQHKIIWRYLAKEIEPYVEKFYGVLPLRVNFLIDVYKIKKDKVDLLVLGAEDDKVEEAQDKDLLNKIRKENDILDDDFLIITGGKLDSNKPQILLLMQAISEIENPKVKLLIFGSISPEYQERFSALLNKKIKYIGWISASETYKYFNVADLVVFPGLHSVFWEQVVGLGKPTVFKYIEGFTHIDLGGNCKFIYQDSIQEMKAIITEIINNEDTYNEMKAVAENKGMEMFSYKKIALKSLNSKKS